MSDRTPTLTVAALALGLQALAAPAFAQHGDHAAHMEMMQEDHAGEVEELSGLSIPDVEVVTQDGEAVRFYSDLVEDRVVAMNFVFTTCTTVCPPMGAIFGQLEKKLGDRAGRDVHLISVSVDPTTDTPERLTEWAAKFGRTAGWTLVTGDKTTVDSLLKSLQVFTPDFEDHAPVVLLGNDARDEWTRAYGLAPPDRMAEILDGLAAGGDAGDRQLLLQGSEHFNWLPEVYTPGAMAGPEALATPPAFDGRLFFSFPMLPDDRTPEAVEAYRALAAEHHLPPRHGTTQLTTLAAARLFEHGVKRAGRDLSRARLVAELEQLYKWDSGLTPLLTFTPNRRIGARGAYVVALDLEGRTFRRAGGWIEVE